MTERNAPVSYTHLVARLEHAEAKGLMHLLDQLEVGGDPRRGVELELDHQNPSTK